MKLPLAYYGDPVLRKKAEKVEELGEELRRLVEDMAETMHAHKGIGLAAPQIHRSLRLFITQVPIHRHQEESGEDSWLPGKLKVYINPILSRPSRELCLQSEGCLSIPKLYGDVERPCRIVVEALDLLGNEFKEELEGLEARCVMHENDHLNGVLFIDRMEAKEKKRLKPHLDRVKKLYKE